MKISKVVLIVVALHVLVIGGIFIFEGCSRAKAPAPSLADNETPAGDQTAANAPALPAPQSLEAAAPTNLTPVSPAAPAAAVASAPATSSAARTYVVKKGDSLWKIAHTQSVSIGELARANNLTKTSALKVGQKLQIPANAKAETSETATASAKSAAPTTTASADGNGALYTVKSGDTLWKIAHAQKVTLASLKQANNLSSDALKVGQKLHLPGASAPTTMASAGTGAPSPAASAGSATASAADWHEPGAATENGQNVHYVDVGESPTIIAKKYNVKVEDLMKANNISDARRMVVGQRLIIPTAQQPVSASAPASTTAATPAVAAPIVSANPVPVGN